MRDTDRARQVTFLGVLAVIAVVSVASVVETFTADPREGEGWIGGPLQFLFLAGPLIAVGIGLRSRRQDVARRTAVASLLLALAAGFVLVMQVLDENETFGDRLVTALGVLLYLAVFAVELPAFTGPQSPRRL